MENVRRSPRNHQGPRKSRSLHIKAANINWESDDSALLSHLISAMESNRRWRHGVFSGRPTSGSGSLHTKADKVIYYDEIAHALFSRHPQFRNSYRKKPAAFARAIKDKLDSFPARCAVEAPVWHGKRTNAVSPRVTLFSYQSEEAWAYERKMHSRRDRVEYIPLWFPKIPLELQFEIMQYAIAPDDCGLDVINLPIAANFARVNRTWLRFIEPLLYQTITLRNQSRFHALFGAGNFLSRQGSPVRYTKALKLYVQPPEEPNNNNLCSTRFHGGACPQQHVDFSIPVVYFDVASAREHFPVIKRLPRERHVQEFANNSMSLHQLLTDLQTSTLHLFMSKPILESEDTTLWSEVMAGHVSALKLMVHLRHLIIDGNLYMTLLPKCVRGWAHGSSWESILKLLKDDGDDALPTLLDETHLTRITFRHTHVPTLAFLARMALANGITSILLAGWNMGSDVPPSWRNFVEREREANDPIITWLDN